MDKSIRRDHNGLATGQEPVAVDYAADYGWGGFWPEAFVVDGCEWRQEAPVVVGENIAGYRYTAADGRNRLVMVNP